MWCKIHREVAYVCENETGDVLKNDEECGRNVATNEEIVWKQFAEMQETVKE